MASGDAQRTWFPEMIATLRREWHPSMPFAELIGLCDRLDGMLHSIRSTRNILSPVFRCPRCGSVGRAAERRVSVRAMILALSRFGISSREEAKALEKSWKKYRRDLQLDLYGKPKATDTGSDHPCSTTNLPRD